MSGNEQEKPTEKEQERKPTTASEFRERFVKGKLVTSPSEATYRIRPIAPHHFLNAWTTRLMSFLEDDEVGQELTEERVKEAIPEAERARGIEAIRPVLCAGVIEPKVIDLKKLIRKPLGNELSVDDLMTNLDDALFLYTQINLMSRKGDAQLGEDFQAGS